MTTTHFCGPPLVRTVLETCFAKALAGCHWRGASCSNYLPVCSPSSGAACKRGVVLTLRAFASTRRYDCKRLHLPILLAHPYKILYGLPVSDFLAPAHAFCHWRGASCSNYLPVCSPSSGAACKRGVVLTLHAAMIASAYTYRSFLPIHTKSCMGCRCRTS
jgi:hypothetical protein